jgi:uncharacterized membrane protein
MATAFALGIAIALTTLVVKRERFPSSFYSTLVGIGLIIAVVELFSRLEETKVRGPISYVRLTLLDPVAAASAALILYGLLRWRTARLSYLASSFHVAHRCACVCRLLIPLSYS